MLDFSSTEEDNPKDSFFSEMKCSWMMLGALGRVTDFLLGKLKGLRLRGCADIGEIRDSSSSV